MLFRSTREQSIKSLEDEISSLQQTVADAQTETSSAGEKNTSYEALLNAYVAYAAKENVKAGESLANVNRDLLSENAQQIYDTMPRDSCGSRRGECRVIKSGGAESSAAQKEAVFR